MSGTGNVRVGWAFEGGGAKGSFSFAAARELIQAGVPVHCISGTSVGALTALLISCDAVDEGSTLWAKLQRSDVLPFRTWKIVAVPYLAMLLFWHAYIWMVSGRRGWPDAGVLRRTLERSSFSVMFLPVWGMCASFWIAGPWPAKAFGLLIFLYFAFAIWHAAADDWPEEEWRRLQGIGVKQVTLSFIAAPVLVLLYVGSNLLGAGKMAGTIGSLPVAYAILIGFALHMFAATMMNRSALSNMPLRRLVGSILKEHPMTLPTYATVAHAKWHFDPDFTSIHASQLDPADPIIYSPAQSESFVPRYIRVDTLKTEEAADCVTASAALPFGLLKSMKIEDRAVVDGGVADNVPIRPLVDDEECDVIFVFRLNSEPVPRSDDRVSQHPDMLLHWKRCWRKEEASNYVPTDKFFERDWSRYSDPEQPTSIPWHQTPSKWPLIILISPKEDLGGLLDFSQATRERRETLGREAARTAIEQWKSFTGSGAEQAE